MIAQLASEINSNICIKKNLCNKLYDYFSQHVSESIVSKRDIETYIFEMIKESGF